MSIYRPVWNVVVATLCGLGAVVALLTIDGGVLFAVSSMSGVVAGVAHYSLIQGGAPRARREDFPRYVTVGAAVGVAVAGCIELLGGVWIPGGLLLVVLSPVVLSGLTPFFRCLPAIAGYLTDPRHQDLFEVAAGDGPFASGPAPDSGPAMILAAYDMTMAELCSAWRSSFLALCGLRDGDPVGRARLVSSRQQYLEELETRDPAGFSRWLAAGAGPGSNPGKYLRSAEVPRPRP